VEHDSWEREKNLENAKEVVVEFKRRINVEIKRWKKLDIVKKRNFRREKLLGRYIVKMLYG